MFDETADRLAQLETFLRTSDPEFAEALDREQRLSDHVTTRTLIMVATDTERRTLLELARSWFHAEPEVVHLAFHSAHHLGRLGGSEVLLVKTAQSAEGPAGATLTAVDAIDQLHPTYVVLVGTAFGLKEGEQQLADVLIATQLRLIDHRKVTPTRQLQRGDSPAASVTLVDRLETVALSPAPYRTHSGPMLTSGTLVNRKSLRQQLKAAHPDAIGGEMEGGGLYAAAAKRAINWGVVKGISDLGYDKTDEDQVRAIQNASDLVFRTLAAGALSRPPGR